MGTSLFKDTLRHIYYTDQLYRRYEVNCVKMHHLEEFSKKILDPDPEADDVQNFIHSSLSIATSVVKFK